MSTGFYALPVAAVVPETERALCLQFEVPVELQERFRFKPGQYLTLRAQIDGEEVRRSYSICSAPSEGALRVAVKQIEGGRFSNWVRTGVKAGDVLYVMPPQGQFTAEPDAHQAKAYCCIAAGSGITPVMSIIKSVLETEPQSRVTLIYGNQRTNTVMFREELSFLKNRYLERLQLIHILSREEQDASVLHGHINNRKGGELQAKRLIDISTFDEFYLCGPEAMISEVSRGLRKEGIDESRIHYELFYANAEDAQVVVAKHHERARQYAGQVSEVTVRMDGRATVFELAADGENILDGAIEAGLDAPYSCKGGVCATCKAKVVEGEVDMDLNHALSADEVARGYVLTCQAHPLTPRVVVDFDQL